jgi:hypothetical protein
MIEDRQTKVKLSDTLSQINTSLADNAKLITNGASFKIKTDGTETLTEFLNAVTEAKAKKSKLWLPNGVIKLSPTTTIDLTDIASLDGNNVILDVSGATASPIFRAKGTKELLRSAFTLTEGDNTINTIPTTLNDGDILVVTSVEPIPNNARSSYFKGERLTVDAYDNTTKIATISPQLLYSYQNAYLWRINESKIQFGRGLTFLGNSGDSSSQKCLELMFANVEIKSNFKNFNERHIDLITSSGVINVNIKQSYYTNSGTSYGIAVNDLSYVDITSEIYGCRHCIAGGGGRWDSNESGGTGTQDCSYPSIYNITGGKYVTNDKFDVGAIDAHGVVESITVTGAVIFGGVSVNARKIKINNNQIYHKNEPGLYISGDGVSTDWTDADINDNKFYTIGVATQSHIRISGKCKRVNIIDNTGDGNWGSAASYYATPLLIDNEVMDLNVKDNKFKRSDIASYEMTIALWHDAVFSGNEFEKTMVYFRAKQSGISLKLFRNKNTLSPTYGFNLYGELADFSFVELVLNESTKHNNAGIFLNKCEKVRLINNRLINNGQNTAASSATRSGAYLAACAEVELNGNDLRDTQATSTQRYGVYHTAHSTLTTEVKFYNNDLRGNGVVHVLAGTILRQSGNLGLTTIPDYIKGTNGNNYKFDGTTFTVA